MALNTMFTDEMVQKTEKEWLTILTDYCSGVFQQVYMPSHNVHHHIRVWKFARSLLLKWNAPGPIFNDAFVAELMFACMLHDVGLSVTPAARHGFESRRLATQFIDNLTVRPDFDTKNLLRVIEQHDDKDYQKSSVSSSDYLYLFLSISDDIDAMGAVGAYRYLEIYFMRRMPLNQIKKNILNNLKGRYTHINERLNDLCLKPDNFKERYQLAVSIVESLSSDGLQFIHQSIKAELPPAVLAKRMMEQSALNHFGRELNYELTTN